MNWEARWIWNDGEESPRNEWWCFRRCFEVASNNWDNASISITADSRYLLYINGEFIGRGPARSWPFEQSYDEYDIGYLLKPHGINTIAVLVLHFGVPTFYYVRGRGGLLAQLEFRNEQRQVGMICTDSIWKTSRYAGQDSRAPRMACQQAFTERIDARIWSEVWIRSEYDDSDWQEAKVIGRVGMKPWLDLKLRDIPQLTEEIIFPVRVESLNSIKPIKWSTAIDLRNHMVQDSVNHAQSVGYLGFIATIIRASEKSKAVLGFPQAFANFGTCWINGRRFESEDFAGEMPERYIEIELLKGNNLFVMDISGYDNGRGFHMGIDCEADIELVSPVNEAGADSSAFITVGPFDSCVRIDHQPGQEISFQDANYIKAKDCLPYGGFTQFTGWVRLVPNMLVSREDVFTLSIWKADSSPQPVPAVLQNVVVPNMNPAEVPIFENKDTEFIIDFGKELSGYIEFDIDAPEGTIIDFYGFEYMRDGWRQDTFALDNTLRYICSEGKQQYSSKVRRGFRYLMVTVRQAKRTVKIYNIHMIQSNYPVAEIGRFQCSDSLLNNIWKMCQYTMRICMEDTFVDCPYEQTFWVGDGRNEAMINYYLYGAEEIVRRGLRLVPGSGYLTPLYTSHAPSGWSNVIPNFTFCWVMACNEYYHQTGDITFVREIWPHISCTLNHYLEKLDSRGLLFINGWNFLDWAPIDQPDDGVVSHQNMFLFRALRMAAELAKLSEDEERLVLFNEAAIKLKAAINLYLWSDERKAYIDCIHADGRLSETFSIQTQIVAYACEVPGEEYKKHIESYLTDTPQDFVKSGSPFISFFHYEGLAKTGQFEYMLDDIRDNYGQMLEHDAATCWEMYPEHTETSTSSKRLTRSHCHAWSSAPCYFLGAYILGIRKKTPAWKEIIIEPHPCGLTWAKGSVPLPEQGRVDVSWRIDKVSRRFNLEVRVPRGIEVEFKEIEGYENIIHKVYL